MKPGVASSKCGVPGPAPGVVAQTAPAGTSDSRPFNSKPTHPTVTRSLPAPSGSTSSV